MIIYYYPEKNEWGVTNKVPKVNQNWADGIVSKNGYRYHCTCEQFRKYHDITTGGCTHIRQVKASIKEAEDQAIKEKSKMEEGG